MSCGCRRDDSVRVADGKSLTVVEFKIQATDHYMRFTVLDEKGKTANTRAYWPEEYLVFEGKQ